MKYFYKKSLDELRSNPKLIYQYVPYVLRKYPMLLYYKNKDYNVNIQSNVEFNIDGIKNIDTNQQVVS